MDIINNTTTTTKTNRTSVGMNNSYATVSNSDLASTHLNHMSQIQPFHKKMVFSNGEIKDFPENDDVETKAYNEEGLIELIDELNALYNPLNLSISFAYNEDIHSLYVQVKRIDTDEVIRQIPSEEAINLMNAMRELQGAIFDTQA